jgi:hypothetical protein
LSASTKYVVSLVHHDGGDLTVLADGLFETVQFFGRVFGERETLTDEKGAKPTIE